MIAAIYIIYAILHYIHRHVIANHLRFYDCSTHLLNILPQRFSIIETSIKVTNNEEINTNRYTIPYVYHDIKHLLPEIINKLTFPPKTLDIIKEKILSEYDDIIIGQDGDINKIYVDTGMGKLFCLEKQITSDIIREKTYNRVANNVAEEWMKKNINTLELDALSISDNWKYVLEKSDNGKFSGYHIFLNNPMCISNLSSITKVPSKYQNETIYWMAVTNNGYTLYTRPYLFYLEWWQIIQKVLVITRECAYGLYRLI